MVHRHTEGKTPVCTTLKEKYKSKLRQGKLANFPEVTGLQVSQDASTVAGRNCLQEVPIM